MYKDNKAPVVQSGEHKPVLPVMDRQMDKQTNNGEVIPKHQPAYMADTIFVFQCL